jgi:hypothetical protein
MFACARFVLLNELGKLQQRSEAAVDEFSAINGQNPSRCGRNRMKSPDSQTVPNRFAGLVVEFAAAAAEFSAPSAVSTAALCRCLSSPPYDTR